jgi:hypothetical protein
MRVPPIIIPIMKPGIMNWLKFWIGFLKKGMYLNDGAHPHQIDGYTMTIVPSQKAGIEIKRIDKVRPR